ncbi:ATP-binding protein [Kitasatospora sp. NPDC097605]|uniref:ATP-binding protein n=1 Tax=Kitasatospora sp. NPDC097605 TaxID=3157226 RepID=UPI00331F5D31
MRALNPPDCTAVRAELRSILHTAGWRPDTIDDAELALQELFINAWQHGDCPAPGVLVSLIPTTLRVTVCDNCPVLPEPRLPADPYALSGRGLHLIQALTHRFGATPTKTGKITWFELDAAA